MNMLSGCDEKVCLASSHEAEPTSERLDILETTVSAVEWKREVERVRPLLKINVMINNTVRPHLTLRSGRPEDECKWICITGFPASLGEAATN